MGNTSSQEPLNLADFAPVRFPHEEAVRVDLAEKGFSIVKVVDDKTNDEIYHEFWEFLESKHPGLDRKDPKTWDGKTWPQTMFGILNDDSVGHAPFMWKARQQEGVLNAFANVWQCKEEELITSYDGACIIRPSEHFPNSQSRKWEHVDQNYFRYPERENIQGLLNLVDSGPQDGGLVVYPYSLKQFEGYFKKNPDLECYPDFVRIHENDDMLKQQKGLPNSGRLKVQAPKGTLLLWDSRTVHCNEPAAEDRNFQEYDKFRAACYLCMKPKSFSNEDELKVRYGYFQEGESTTHYPTSIMSKGAPCDPNYKPVEMNQKVKNLIGYDEIEVPDRD